MHQYRSFFQKPQKLFLNNNQDHEQFQNQFEYYLHCDFLTIQKVKYVNDSKGTNVNAAYYALESIKGSVIWIAGGVDKGNDYKDLIPLVNQKVKAIICLGVDNKKIIETFSPIIDLIVETESMEEAVKISRKIAEKKDAVLLSPACASFDLFKDYEDRGNQFKEAIRNL